MKADDELLKQYSGVDNNGLNFLEPDEEREARREAGDAT